MAALLLAQDGADAVGVTLELWSDPENDGELSCCSAQAVRGARELAHGLGMAHLSIDLREEFRAGVVTPWLEDHAAGLTPNPCVRCNGSVRLDAMLELAGRLGSSTLATGHYARVHEGPLLQSGRRSSPRTRATCCAGSQPTRWSGCVSRSARCTSPRCATWPSAPRCPWPAAATPRTFASWREPASAPSWSVTADWARGRGRSSAWTGERLGEHAGAHVYTVGQRHGLGLSSSEPLYVLATDTGSNTVTVGPRRALLAGTLAVSGLTLHSESASVDGVRVRAHGRTHPCRIDGELDAGRACAGADRASGARRAHRAGAGRVPVRRRSCRRSRHHRGLAALAPPKIRSEMNSDEIRERYLSFFEERGHKRIPSASLVPSAHDPSALLTVAGMHPAEALLPGPGDPSGAATDRLPEGLPDGRHRQRRQHGASPDVLRDARQLLVRRLLQGGGDRSSRGSSRARSSASPRRTSG